MLLLWSGDIKGFFDHIDHTQLLNMLMRRIDDKPLLKLIRRWLEGRHTGYHRASVPPMSGTPQGGIISPILANVYLHYALDMWFEEKVKRHCQGNATLYRYADDFVCCFERVDDAQRFYGVLPSDWPSLVWKWRRIKPSCWNFTGGRNCVSAFWDLSFIGGATDLEEPC